MNGIITNISEIAIEINKNYQICQGLFYQFIPEKDFPGMN